MDRKQASPAVAMLRAMLRYKRSCLSRTDVGLGPRLVVRQGLSQDDLAELTGYSVRVIADLERGRLRSPGPELLDAVSNGLRLTADERRSLWLLAAGSMPPFGAYSVGPDAGLTRMVDQMYPHPAYLTDALWNVLAYNRGIAEWFTDFSSVPPPDRNIAKWIFCDPHAQHVFVHWEADFARIFLARMRAVAARFPDEPNLAALVGELRARSSYFRSAWTADATVYMDAPTETRVFRRPGRTDPSQVDDVGSHVPIDMVILAPLQLDDQRRLVCFMLPEGEVHRPDTHSALVCAACGGAR